MVISIILIVMAYLLGSVPFGYIVSKRIYRLDIQKVGSGNIGATNVYRNLGWTAAILTALGDLGKGIVPVLLAKFAGCGPLWLAYVGLATVLGHCFPLFLRFRGGKGVSTTVAVLLVLNPVVFALFVGFWLIVLLSLGRVSVASLAAAAATPLTVKVFLVAQPGLLFFSWAAAVIIFLRHHQNIDRLMKGTEKAFFSPGEYLQKIKEKIG